MAGISADFFVRQFNRHNQFAGRLRLGCLPAKQSLTDLPTSSRSHDIFGGNNRLFHMRPPIWAICLEKCIVKTALGGGYLLDKTSFKANGHAIHFAGYFMVAIHQADRLGL